MQRLNVYNEVSIARSDLSKTRIETKSPESIETGQIRVSIESIGLSANNISYAAAGDALGYWAHFSREDAWGVLPVWGFGRVSEGMVEGINSGELLFGYWPMASQCILTPTSISDLCFSEGAAPRAQLHPWYGRYYRCANDPAHRESLVEIQPILWALFMTGWMAAEQLHQSVDSVYISSASSKTAISLAWALQHCDGATESVGITSINNKAFVESLQVYSKVITYDEMQAAGPGSTTAYVDIAGNAKVTSDAHVMLGESLVSSMLIGATHRAPAEDVLPMPGPPPNFFFIPDVAEQKAAELGLANYHQGFADSWLAFAKWSATWMSFQRGSGVEAIEQGYQTCLSGDVAPTEALTFTWE